MINETRKILPFTSSQQWISQESFYRSRLKLYDNVIECTNTGYFYGSIELKEKFEFTIQVTQVELYFSVGIADRELTVKEKRETKSNWITIINDGRIMESGTQIGNIGFSLSIGDKVRIFGDLDSCIIGFDINGIVVFEEKCSKFKDKLCWVPEIYLYDSGDSIKICDCFDEAAVVDTWFVESIYQWDEDLVYDVHHIMAQENENNELEFGNQDKSENVEEILADSFF